jgi:hypothetical protein
VAEATPSLTYEHSSARASATGIADDWKGEALARRISVLRRMRSLVLMTGGTWMEQCGHADGARLQQPSLG